MKSVNVKGWNVLKFVLIYLSMNFMSTEVMTQTEHETLWKAEGAMRMGRFNI